MSFSLILQKCNARPQTQRCELDKRARGLTEAAEAAARTQPRCTAGRLKEPSLSKETAALSSYPLLLSKYVGPTLPHNNLDFLVKSQNVSPTILVYLTIASLKNWKGKD